MRIKRHKNLDIAKNVYVVDQNKWESTAGVAKQHDGTGFRFKTYDNPIQEQVQNGGKVIDIHFWSFLLQRGH